MNKVTKAWVPSFKAVQKATEVLDGKKQYTGSQLRVFSALCMAYKLDNAKKK